MKDEINTAIGKHGLWKGRLRTAINTGQSEYTQAKVLNDSDCDFGKWLNGSTEAKSCAQYMKVKELHAKFHRDASDVMKAALEGKRSEAEKMMLPGSAFAKSSSELVQMLMAWAQQAK